ncbi:hypothetical protein DV515_00010481 [Chloebia gouldiae]|uniref:Uncharacterized protein n=1 Tax=Chloebia gouldiae TaxID=44316 RepID=A0A3L8S903_CHLGU|nr:hypothetical protein DV515_00010481 [Chloebia gouldiae]
MAPAPRGGTGLAAGAGKETGSALTGPSASSQGCKCHPMTVPVPIGISAGVTAWHGALGEPPNVAVVPPRDTAGTKPRASG